MKNHEQHRKHEHTIETERWRLKNVAYVHTHDLVRCHEDTFFGWVLKEES
ncbi:hypothetical protein SEA_LIFES_88 [Microbacterium phage Lifes]|nr:hypothetical protein SEA_LIFES_88 [Microbacterium phage Lifes]